MKERNYFVYIVGVVLVVALGFVLYREFMPALIPQYEDGELVYGTWTDGNIKEGDLQEYYDQYDGAVEYVMWKNAVIDAAVPDEDLTDEENDLIKSNIDSLKSTFKDEDYDNWDHNLRYALASNGILTVEEYAKIGVKQLHMNAEYLEEHWDEYKEDASALKARKILILTTGLQETAAIEEVDNALDDGMSFEDAVSKYSQASIKDPIYIDNVAVDDIITLPDEIKDVLFNAEEGTVTKWYTLDENNSNMRCSIRFKVVDTNIDNMTDETTIYNSLASYGNLHGYIINEVAKDLDITYSKEGMQEKIEMYSEAAAAEATIGPNASVSSEGNTVATYEVDAETGDIISSDVADGYALDLDSLDGIIESTTEVEDAE